MNILEKNPSIIYRKDYQESDFLINTVDLVFELDPINTLVSNTMTLYRNPNRLKAKDLILNGAQNTLTLVSLYLNEKLLIENTDYQIYEDSLKIFNVPDSFTLKVQTRCNPSENTELNGLYLSQGIFCTQCESHGFQRITYYLDRPDVMAKFTTTLIAKPEDYPVLLSNGNCIIETLLPNGFKKVVWEDPFKKPCYLFALVAGKLDCYEDFFISQSGRKITLKIFVEPGNASKSIHAMEMLKKSMRWDEERYGREYDLDIFMIVAVSSFNMGAMENKGLNIFNAKYILANPETATDTDYEGIAIVVAHEYFHNWTGNRITCRDWFQLSLKEGLTVFRDQQFTEDLLSPAIARIDQVRNLRLNQFPEDAGPLAHPVRPDSYLEMNNFYTATVYNKGAEVIRMLHVLEGEKGYRDAMNLYFDRFDGMAVTCDDFLQAHADANQKNYMQFSRWYSQAGTPELIFTDEYDANNQIYRLRVKQKTHPTADQSPKEAFHLPIKIALLNEKTAEKYFEGIIELTEEEQIFDFENVSPSIPSLMRGFSAPVRWEYPYSLSQRIFLLQHDDDLFNRFEMAQQLFNHFFLEDVSVLPENYLMALNSILNDSNLDPGIKARLLTFPSYHELAEQMTLIDVDQTIKRRDSFIRQISKMLEQDLIELLESLISHHKNTPYIFSTHDIGLRALINAGLYLLIEANHPKAFEWVEDLYIKSNNMTNRFNALNLGVKYGSFALKEKLLTDFYQNFAKDDLLILDKWFMVQASIPKKDTLLTVEKLCEHSDFDIKNPNQVRSLLGVFSLRNFIGFHLSDGSAYEFLAEKVLILDRLNPQIAARLVEPLLQWRRYTDEHAVLMRSALQKIALISELSSDLYEKVMKSI